MSSLSILYMFGRGVNKDEVEALRLLRKAADAGYPPGINNLGALYESGRGVDRDRAEAMRLYRKAADGVFTYALLDALVNGDTNNDGKIELSELTAHIQTLAPKLSHELRGGRGLAVAQKSRAMQQLGDTPIASRYADYRQKPRMGSRGEDFPLVNRLPALPAAPAQ